MELWQRIKKCIKEIKALFKKSIGPLAVFLFFYYLATKFILFPVGGMIWSRTLALLPDGYIGLGNVDDLWSHPIVIVVGFLLVVIYCAITFLQIECAFIFVEYRYHDKVIGFNNLVGEVFKRTLKVFKPRNWPILLLVVLAIPFIDIFSVTTDIGSIVIPEYILTVVQQKTPLLILYVVVKLLLLYLVLKGLYVEITFPYEKNFKEAFRHSGRLTKGLLNKIEKLFGLLLARIFTYVLFALIPSLLVHLIHFISKLTFGDSATFKPTMEILENTVAYPAINAFSAAVSCAVIISLIVVWFHTDSESTGEGTFELSEYESSKFVANITKKFTLKVFAGVVGICVVLYCVLIPVCVQTLKHNQELLVYLSSPTEIIAHKGYTSRAPENTIPALNEAIECGNATIVEFDVQATKDGVPVVIHDSNANGITGVDKDICEMNLDEVKTLDAAYHFDGNKYKGTQIPTLEEYLKACDHRVTLLLEIKNYNKDPQLEKNIMAILKKYDYWDGSCMIHSGSVDSLKKVKAINPDMQCGFIMAVAIGTFYDLPYADFFSIETSFVSYSSVEEIHSRAKPVYVWTVDERDVVEDVYNAGADGIICDDPDLVSEFLEDYAGNVVSYSQKKTKRLIKKYGDTINDVISNKKKEQVNTQYGD